MVLHPINSFWPIDVIWYCKTWLSLVQVMACHLKNFVCMLIIFLISVTWISASSSALVQTLSRAQTLRSLLWTRSFQRRPGASGYVLDSFPVSYIDELVQEKRNSSALAMESHLSCINPSKSSHVRIFWPETIGENWLISAANGSW